MKDKKKKTPPKAAIVQKGSFIVVVPPLPDYLHGEVNRSYWLYADPECVITKQYYEEVQELFEHSLAASQLPIGDSDDDDSY